MKIAFHANRRRRTHFLIFTALITAAMVARMDGADHPTTTLTIPADVEKIAQDILASKYPHESSFGPGVAKGYRTLFKEVGPQGLAALQIHPAEGIAIQAAWEEVALTVPENKPAAAIRPDRHKLDWFLGFLEGRARVKAPQWWSHALLNSGANRRNNIYPGFPIEPPYHNLGLDETVGPLDTSLKREAGKFVLRIGNESVPIPENLLQKFDSGKVYGDVSALMTPSRCYVAVHDAVGYPYQLTCIDRVTAKVIWKSDVFGSWWGGASGVHETQVAVTEQNGRIVLFGAGSTGIHVEAFRLEDGGNLFRFSSSY